MGGGLAMEAVLESAGPECVVPGQVTPLRLLGVKVDDDDNIALRSLDLFFIISYVLF